MTIPWAEAEEGVAVGKIAVVTDGVACVRQDPERQYKIHVVPFQVIWDGYGQLLVFLSDLGA